MPIQEVFYVSSASGVCDDKSIQSILQISRRNNRQRDVTGCLLFSGHHFAQVLEGKRVAVTTVMERVARDTRHTGIRVLFDATAAARHYNEWDMGYMHDGAMEDELEQLQSTPSPDGPRVRRMMLRMRLDGMGGFNNLK